MLLSFCESVQFFLLRMFVANLWKHLKWSEAAATPFNNSCRKVMEESQFSQPFSNNQTSIIFLEVGSRNIFEVTPINLWQHHEKMKKIFYLVENLYHSKLMPKFIEIYHGSTVFSPLLRISYYQLLQVLSENLRTLLLCFTTTYFWKQGQNYALIACKTFSI